MPIVNDTDHLINSAFSIHFMVESDLIIHSPSDTLKRFMPNIEGQPLMTVFKIQRPSGISSFEDLLLTGGKMALFEAKDGSFAVRGQLVDDIEGRKCRFVGSPWLAWMSKNNPQIGMKLDDFSAIDPQLDLLILLSTERQNLVDLEQLAAELQQAHQTSITAYRAQADFFAIMSHEMRTPLNGLAMALELIDKRQLAGDSLHMHDVATHSADNLKNVINSVLDYSKLQSGGFTNDPVEFYIEETIDAALMMIEAKASQQQIELVKNLDEALTCALIGDESKIRQVLINLLSNAIKFTADGSITLTGRMSDDNTQLLLNVEDTGPGIPDSIKPYIFKPFWTLEEDQTDIGSGTGLGLNICYQMVEIIGGEISFATIVDIGTRFDITIPVEKSASNTLRKHDYEQTSNPQFIGKVLLAEDNKVNQLLMMKILEKRGLDVDIADNGKDAIKWIENTLYDLVFMDISMPVMGGIKATRKLRETYSRDVLPIIALTAHSGQDKVGEYLACGMNSVMSKPIDSNTLNLTLGQWLASSPQTASISGESALGSALDLLMDEAVAERLIADIGIAAYQDIAALFETECSTSIVKITTEYNELNFDEVSKAAHAILSSARSLGLSKLGQQLKSLELAAKDTNTSEMNILISTLNSLTQESLIALEEYAIAVGN
jgi:signal transduction histidine kinase/CheY-like chemotaxis protein